MSGTIRIGQSLGEGYNPDGTPGTVSTGVQGDPGRAPTIEEIANAVALYIIENPITVEAITTSSRAFNRFGEGSGGTPGTYVDIGSHELLHAFVTANGTPQVVNLYLQSKNGRIIAEGNTEITGSLLVDGKMTLVSGADVNGPISMSDASTGISRVALTAALAEVVATPVYTYTLGGQTQRGFLASDLSTAITNSTSKSSLISLIATLWQAVRELEIRELTT